MIRATGRGSRRRPSAPGSPRGGEVAPGGGAARAAGPAPGPAPIPFDYGASLRLIGQPGNIVQGVITISPDSAFVATGIGYGFAEDLARPIAAADIQPVLGPPPPPAPPVPPVPQPFNPGRLRLDALPPRALIEGFRIAPRAVPLVFDVNPDERIVTEPEALQFRPDFYPWARVGELLQRLEPPREVAFLLSLVDSATGRELQDEPIHNLASLGRSDGRRPFRPLAAPMAFLPRSTIRLQVVERQQGRTGRLDVVLFGYKVPGTSGRSEAEFRRAIAAAGRRRRPRGARLIPFDYVAQVRLTGTPEAVAETELPINVEGTFLATAVSYALDPTEEPVPIDRTARPAFQGLPAEPTLDNNNLTFRLRDVTLDRFPPDALLDGIRLRPEYVRFAFDAGGALDGAVRIEIADALFERLNRPEQVRFRYRFHDAGAGRDLQNGFLDSVAGLGIATGERPFKTLARPLEFEPRSTLQVSIRELRGRGMLHVVFQGYKYLDARSRP